MCPGTSTSSPSLLFPRMLHFLQWWSQARAEFRETGGTMLPSQLLFPPPFCTRTWEHPFIFETEVHPLLFLSQRYSLTRQQSVGLFIAPLLSRRMRQYHALLLQLLGNQRGEGPHLRLCLKGCLVPGRKGSYMAEDS